MNDRNLSSEPELFSRIAQGNTQAFAEAHDRYKARLLYYGKRFLPEWDEVEDVVADAFMALWLSRTQIRSDAHLRNFLFVTVRNKAINRIETRQRQESLLANVTSATSEDAALSAEMVETEMLHLLKEAVKALPQEYRKIFELAYDQEFSPGEIAQLLQMNPATVRSQKRRAIQMIREWIQKRSPLTLLILGLLAANYPFYKKFLLFLAR